MSTSTPELVVFAHGMRNFAHNPGTREDQERLLREALAARRHTLVGAFGPTGNFAFVTSSDAETLRSDVLAALNRRYRVRGVVVVTRERCVEALNALEQGATTHFGSRFQAANYSVSRPPGRWRLGFVFTDLASERGAQAREALGRLRHHHVGLLSVEGAEGGIVGVVKYDPPQPRIPWGVPAGLVAKALTGIISGVATARSARTVRGILELFDPSGGTTRQGASFDIGCRDGSTPRRSPPPRGGSTEAASTSTELGAGSHALTQDALREGGVSRLGGDEARDPSVVAPMRCRPTPEEPTMKQLWKEVDHALGLLVEHVHPFVVGPKASGSADPAKILKKLIENWPGTYAASLCPGPVADDRIRGRRSWLRNLVHVALDARHRCAHHEAYTPREAQFAVLAMLLFSQELTSRGLGASGPFESQLQTILDNLREEQDIQLSKPDSPPPPPPSPSKEGQHALPLPKAWLFLEARGLEGEVESIKGRIPGTRPDRRRTAVKKLLQQKGLLAEFIRLYWPMGK